MSLKLYLYHHNIGEGAIVADGGGDTLTNCSGPSGSGGRIDIISFNDSLFRGEISAMTGQSYNFSGAGTIIRRSNG